MKWIKRWAMAERLFWQQLCTLWDRGGHDPGDALFRRWVRACHRPGQAIGRQRAVELWKHVFVRTSQQPLLSGLIAMISRYSDLGPARLCQHSPRIYEHITRECGRLAWAVDDDQQSGTIELLEFPTRGPLVGCWARGLQGCIVGAIAALGVQASVEAMTLNEADGFAAYRVTW